MQSLILFFLRFFARRIIEKYRPFVIGVTGTVGKTTITANIAHALSLVYPKTDVGYSPYHYNGEYGLPLTIIGAKTGGKNPLLWLGVLFKAISTLSRKSYPKYLILEYGIDHPGEMEYMLSIVKPDIAILSPVAPNHLEQFGSFEKYEKAKLLLLESALSHRIAHESHKEKAPIDTLYYGHTPTSTAHMSLFEQDISGSKTELKVSCRSLTLSLPSFGSYQAENILPVLLVFSLLDLDIDLLREQSDIFRPEPGRSLILDGINEKKIIDGSYNGGYESISKGLTSLLPFREEYSLFILLGDMRELGDEAPKMHKKIASELLELFEGVPRVEIFLVGPIMKEYVIPEITGRLLITWSLSSESLGEKLRERVFSTPGEGIVYVKGSQNTIFLEEAVKLLLEHDRDQSLLCRQSGEWIQTKKKFFQGVEKRWEVYPL